MVVMHKWLAVTLQFANNVLHINTHKYSNISLTLIEK